MDGWMAGWVDGWILVIAVIPVIAVIARAQFCPASLDPPFPSGKALSV
jgi:hypothetical protein